MHRLGVAGSDLRHLSVLEGDSFFRPCLLYLMDCMKYVETAAEEPISHEQ